MPNSIIYNVSAQSLALKKGNFYIGTGDVGKGPSSSTGYFDGVTPGANQYVIYYNKSGSNRIYYCTNGDQVYVITNRLKGQNLTTLESALAYIATQNDMMCTNINYESISTNGLLLNLDAGFTPSYPMGGTSWYDLDSTSVGTLVNGPTYSTNGGGSILFDGIDDSSSISTVLNGLTGLTINIWFYSNVASSTALVRGGSSIILLHFRGAGFYLTDSAGVNSGYLGWNTQPTSLNWIMLTGTWDGTTMKLYQNGVKQATDRSFTGTGILANIGTINLGYYFNSSQPWTNGYISNSQIYNRALSDSEVLQTYNLTKGRFGL